MPSEAGEPAISLSIKAPNGTNRKMLLVFTGNNKISGRNHLYDNISRLLPENKQTGDGGLNTRQNFSGNSCSQRESHQSCFSPETAQNEKRPPDFMGEYNSGINAGNSCDSDYPLRDYRHRNNTPCSYNKNSRISYNQRNSKYRQASKSTFSGLGKRDKTADLGSFGGTFSGRGVDTDSLAGTFTAFLTSPFEAYRSARRKDLSDTVPVLVTSFTIFAFANTISLGILASGLDSAVYPSLSTLTDIGTIIFVSVEIIIAGILITALNGFLIHLATYYYGYDDDMENALKITAYSSVPYGTGGIIPVFGIIIAPLWSLYLQVKGVEERYSIDINQAAVFVLIPFAFFIILFAVFAITGGDNFSIFG